MFKIFFSFAFLVFLFSCSDDASKVTDVGVVIDTTKEDTTHMIDTLDSADTLLNESINFNEDSIKFMDIDVAFDENVLVSWNMYPDSNVENYAVYYKKGETVTLNDQSVICLNSDSMKSIVSEKFEIGEKYSFLVVAVLFDGESTHKVISNIKTITVGEAGSNDPEATVYNVIQLDKSVSIEIKELNVINGYELVLPSEGEYELSFSTLITTSGFNPNVTIYSSDTTTILASESGIDPITFTSSGTVYIEMSIDGTYNSGASIFKIKSK